MPIETNPSSLVADDLSIGAAFLAEARSKFSGALTKIVHCLDQLSDDDIQWRQSESHNSIQNVILHLCGNVQQWILHGVGGEPDHRNRPAEFTDRAPRSRDELASLLRQTFARCDKVLAEFPPRRLLETRRIQSFEVNVLAAILDTASHFVGHQHQIVYITRLRLGDAYRFQWTPETPEQGAPK
jgi:hypothetical protein